MKELSSVLQGVETEKKSALQGVETEKNSTPEKDASSGKE